MINVIVLSISSILSLASAVSGMVAFSAAKSYKGILLTAVILLLLAAVFAAVAAVIVHRKGALHGFLPLAVLITSLLLKFISNILLLFVIIKLKGSDQQTTIKAAVSAMVMSGVSITMSGVLLLILIIAHLRKPVIQTAPTTIVTQKPPYSNPNGAREQLDLLKTATPQAPGASITIGAKPSRPLNPQAPEFVPGSALGFL